MSLSRRGFMCGIAVAPLAAPGISAAQSEMVLRPGTHLIEVLDNEIITSFEENNGILRDYCRVNDRPFPGGVEYDLVDAGGNVVGGGADFT